MCIVGHFTSRGAGQEESAGAIHQSDQQAQKNGLNSVEIRVSTGRVEEKKGL
jgi:hypothetical protein